MEPENVNAYPLDWPRGWPRFRPDSRTRARFRTQIGESYGSRKLSIAEATRRVARELDLFGLRDSHRVLSTNLTLRRDGLPRSDQRPPVDPGAAVYFRMDGERDSLACDRWDRVADNIAAIAAHLGAMRGQDRWGVGNPQQAFAGYKALPAPASAKPWHEVLGIPENSEIPLRETAFRRPAKIHHPDAAGGSNEAMQEINRAWDEARA